MVQWCNAITRPNPRRRLKRLLGLGLGLRAARALGLAGAARPLRRAPFPFAPLLLRGYRPQQSGLRGHTMRQAQSSQRLGLSHGDQPTRVPTLKTQHLTIGQPCDPLAGRQAYCAAMAANHMRDVRSDFHRRLFFVAAFLVVGFMLRPWMDSGPEGFAPGNYTNVTNSLAGV